MPHTNDKNKTKIELDEDGMQRKDSKMAHEQRKDSKTEHEYEEEETCRSHTKLRNLTTLRLLGR
jgi:hypothetical protein